VSAWLDEITSLLTDSLGEREPRVNALRAAREMDKLPGDFGGLKAAFHAWTHRCGFLNEASKITEGLPWTVLKEDHEIEMVIRDRHRFTRGANLAELIEAEKKDQTARWESRVNRCKVALIDGWPDEDALCFICALDEWNTALRRAGRRAA
jgi:hypothetical protein